MFVGGFFLGNGTCMGEGSVSKGGVHVSDPIPPAQGTWSTMA